MRLSGVCSPPPLPSFYVRPSHDALCFKTSKMWTGGCQTASKNSCLEMLYWHWQELSFTISPQNQCQSELSNRIRMLDKEIYFKVQTSSPKMQASAYTLDKLHKWPRLYLDFAFTEFSSAFYKCSKASISIPYKYYNTAFDCRIQARNGIKLRCSQAELTHAIKAAVGMFSSISCRYPEIEGGTSSRTHGLDQSNSPELIV